MYFVHPQIKLSRAAKAKLSLIKPVNLSKLTEKLSFYFPNKQFVFTDMGREALKVIIEKMNLQNSEMLLPAYICEIFYPIQELKNYSGDSKMRDSWLRDVWGRLPVLLIKKLSPYLLKYKL